MSNKGPLPGKQRKKKSEKLIQEQKSKPTQTMSQSVKGKTEPIIGIGGGVGPAAGVLLHTKIIENTITDGTDQSHFKVYHFSRSVSVPDRTKFLLGEITQNPGEGMAEVMNALKASSDVTNDTVVAGVPCNTFHASPIWDRFCSRMKELGIEEKTVRVVHMLKATIKMIRELVPDCKKIGLMSTTGTRNSRVYRVLLEPGGYEVLEVPENMQAELHDSIYNPEWGVKAVSPVTEKAVSNFQGYTRNLIQQGADAIILGCTEIPIAMPQKIFEGVPLVDPVLALARAMITLANPKKLKKLQSNPEKLEKKSSPQNYNGGMDRDTTTTTTTTTNTTTTTQVTLVEDQKKNRELHEKPENEVEQKKQQLEERKNSFLSAYKLSNTSTKWALRAKDISDKDGVTIGYILKPDENIVVFQPDSLGFERDCNKISCVIAKSQAEHAGVKKGWFISKINDTDISKYTDIGTLLKEAKASKRSFKIHFLIDSPVTSLSLNGNKIGDVGSAAIGDALKTNLTLTRLSLSHNEITDIGAGCIGDALKFNSTLADLHMGRNKITDVGAVAIGDALKTNFTLRQLSLNHNQIADIGAKALGNALAFHLRMSSFNVVGNEIGDAGTVSIGDALKCNTMLTDLNMRGNKIGDVGATSIGCALKYNTTLRILELPENKIGDVGAIAIGEALKINQTITNLNLNANQIADDGAARIGEALEINSTVTLLGLAVNQISDDGFSALGEGLKGNHVLDTLTLSKNTIGDRSATVIGDCLKINSRLNVLHFYDNKFSCDTKAALKKIQKNHHPNLFFLM